MAPCSRLGPWTRSSSGSGTRRHRLRQRQPVRPPRVGATAQAWRRLRACSPLVASRKLRRRELL
jgi:hypothetical protein